MIREAIQYVDLQAISVNPQVRDNANDESLQGLAVSMREVGQLQPIRVRRRGEGFVVVDGERRLRAVALLGWETIAAIIEERELCEAEVTQRQLIANAQRKQHKPLEAARAIHEMMQQTGWNASQAAEKLGFSAATISRLLALLSLPESIQERVRSGAIAGATGYHLTQVADPAKQAELANEAANGRLSRDAASKKARESSESGAVDDKPLPTRAKAELGDGRSVTVAGKNLTLEVFLTCLEQLLSRARQAHRQGVELTSFLKFLKQSP